MRKWHLVGLIIVLAAAGAYFIRQRSDLLLVPAKGALENYLSETFHLPVSLGEISTNYLNSVLVRDIQIGDREHPETSGSLHVEKIVLRYSLWDLIENRTHPVQSLRHAEILNPEIVLPSHFETHASTGSQIRVPAVGFEVSWKGGRLKAPGLGLEFSDLSGSWEESAPSEYTLETRARTPQGEDLSAQFRFVQGENLWEGNFTAKNAALEKWFALVPSPNAQGIEGRANLSFTVTGDFSKLDAWRTWPWKASVDLLGARYQPKGMQEPLSLEGGLDADPEEFRFRSVRLRYKDSPFSLKGRAPLPGSGKSFDVVLESERASLENLQELAQGRFEAHIPLAGSARIACKLEGTPANPALSGSMDLEQGRVGLIGFTTGQMQWSWAKETFQLTSLRLASFGGGWEGHGTISAKKMDLALTAWDLSLAQWASQNQMQEIPGTASLETYLSGTPDKPRAKGQLRIRGIKLSDSSQPDTFSGSFQFSQGRLSAEGSSPTSKASFDMNLDLSQKPDITLNTFDLFIPPTGRLTAKGTIRGPERTLSGSISLNQWQARHLPFLGKRYPGATGEVFFIGRLQGSLSAPTLQGRLTSQNLKLLEGTQLPAAKLSASIQWDKQGIEIPDANWNDEYSGSMNFKHDAAGQPQLTLRWSAKNADVSQLAALALFPKDPGEIRGRLSGTGRLVYKPQGVSEDEAFPTLTHCQGEASFLVVDGAWAGQPFQRLEWNAVLDPQSGLNVPSFRVIQPSGSLEAKLKLGVRGAEAPLQASAVFKEFAWRSLKIDGNVALDGRLETDPTPAMKGKIVSTRWQVNNKGGGALGGRFSYRNGLLNLEEWSWGSFLKGSLTVNMKEPGTALQGKFVSKPLDIQEWWNLFFPDEKPQFSGLVQGQAEIGGHWKDPEFHIRYAFTNGRWKSVSFQFAGKSSLEKQKLVFEPSLLSLGSGERFILSGNMDFSKAPGALNLTLESAAKGPLKLETVSKALDLPGALKGEALGRIRLEGPLSAPKLSGSLSGKESAFWNQKIVEWESQWVLSEKRLSFESLHAKSPEGEWWLKSGSAVDFDTPGAGRFLLHTELRNIHAGPMDFFGGLSVNGDFHLGEDPPRWEASLKTRGLYVNQYDFDQASLRVSFQSKTLTFLPVEGSPQQISGALSFGQGSEVQFRKLKLTEGGQPVFSLDGKVSPQEWDFTLDGKNMESALLIGLLDWRTPVEGKVDVSLKSWGTFDTPQAAGSLQSSGGKIRGVPYDSLSAKFTLKNDLLSLSAFKAEHKDAYVLTGKGSWPLVLTEQRKSSIANRNRDVRLSLSNGNLRLLKLMYEEIGSAKGSLEGSMHLAGTAQKPLFEGSFEIKNGEVTGTPYFEDLNDFTLQAAFSEDTLQIKKCTGRLGSGLFTSGGELVLGPHGIEEMDLKLSSVGQKGLSILIPQLPITSSTLFKRITSTPSKGSPLCDLRLTGTPEEPKLSGTIELRDTRFSYPPRRGSSGGTGGESRFQLGALDWDVELKAGENTTYENEFAQALVRGSLKLKGKSHGDMIVDGRVEAIQGKVGYLGTEMDIKQAVFELVPTQLDSGKIKNIPYLSAIAETERLTPDPITGTNTRDTIRLMIDRAPISDLKPRFVSKNNPSLAQERVLALTTGMDTQNLTPEERDSLMRRGVAQLLDSTLTAPFIQTLARTSGLIDSVRVSYAQPEDPVVSKEKPNGETGTKPVNPTLDALRGTKYTLGKQFGSRALLEYSFRFDEFQNKLDLKHELQVSYRIGGNVFFRASSELDTRNTLGRDPDRRALIEQQWRFNWGTTKNKKPPRVPTQENPKN